MTRIRIDEATLRAYLDKALPDYELDRIEQHLARSSSARAILARLRRDMDETGEALSLLAATAVHHSPASQALKHLQANLADQPKLSVRFNLIERIRIMFTKSFFKRHQAVVTALTLLLVLLVALSFAPVRAIAGDLLKVFRVQQVKVIPVDVNRFEGNEELGNVLEQFSPETETIVDGGEPREVAGLNEAAARVDFAIAKVTNAPPDAGSLNKIAVLDRSVHRVRLDPALAEAIFEAAGIEIELPDSLDETPVVLTRPTMVMQIWGDEDHDGLRFAQLRSPEIEYPDDLDLNELGVATLRFLGLSEAEAIALGATINWANTLVLPVPSDGDVTITEVSINGASGALFQKNGRADNAVMWQKDGLTYMLSGPYNANLILEIAKSVR